MAKTVEYAQQFGRGLYKMGRFIITGVFPGDEVVAERSKKEAARLREQIKLEKLRNQLDRVKNSGKKGQDSFPW